MKALAAATLVAITVALAGQSTQAPSDGPLLRGAIDIHVHSFPDKNPRSLDAIDAATFAHRSGMRAIVLKNHYEPTAGLAYIVRKAVPGIEVFGGIDLNLTVGGINPAAVEYMVQESGGWGRFVWMPTFDAENQVRYSKENRPFVSVSKDGALLPQVRDVIAIIAKNSLVLATGHSSSDEGLMLVREGRKQGVRRMVVTHAMNPPIVMDIARMKEAAQLGAFIEFVGGSLESADAAARMERFAAAIKAIGPEFCILSSDLGQRGNPIPTEGFAAFLAAMRARGFTAQQVDRMSKENPARLLGL
jgi:hypothetical protein